MGMASISRRARLRSCLLWSSVVVLFRHCVPVEADCGGLFLFPIVDTTFQFQDYINVTYQSNFSTPILRCMCNPPSPQQRFQTNPPAYNGSQLVQLDWITSSPCWFEIQPDSLECSDNSTQFSVLPEARAQSTTIGLTPTPTGTPATPMAVVGSGGGTTNGGDISPGAKVGMSIGIAIAGIAAGVLAAVLFFKYRRRKGLRAGFRGAMMPIGPGDMGHVNAEKQYPPSRPAAGGMAATIQHRGDFDWQNMSEAAYDDPAKAPLSPNMSSIGPVGYYGPESDAGSSTRSRAMDREPRPYSWGSSHEGIGTSSTGHLTDLAVPFDGDRSYSETEMAAILPTYTSSTHFDGDTKGARIPTDTAELPTNDSFPRRPAEEFELPAQAPYKPHHPQGRDLDEQKFLLSDVEMAKLRQQKQRQRDERRATEEGSQGTSRPSGQGG